MRNVEHAAHNLFNGNDIVSIHAGSSWLQGC